MGQDNAIYKLSIKLSFMCCSIVYDDYTTGLHHVTLFAWEKLTNCERRRRQATLAFLKMKVIVALISVSSHPIGSEYLNMGREREHIVQIIPVNMTVKRNIEIRDFVPSQKWGVIGYSVPPQPKVGDMSPPPPLTNDAHDHVHKTSEML